MDGNARAVVDDNRRRVGVRVQSVPTKFVLRFSLTISGLEEGGPFNSFAKDGKLAPPLHRP